MMTATGTTTPIATLYLVARPDDEPDDEPDGSFPAATPVDVGPALSLLGLAVRKGVMDLVLEVEMTEIDKMEEMPVMEVVATDALDRSDPEEEAAADDTPVMLNCPEKLMLSWSLSAIERE